MRPGWFVLALGVLGGCTSVRVMQRDDCWVRQKTRWPGQVKEELGFCKRPEPAWAQDRLSRVVQECLAQADYRWQNRALAAWERGEPLPDRESDQQVLDRCMSESTRMAVVENEALQERLADAKDEREKWRASETRLAEALGEAAKKPANVTATASARGDGSSSTQHDAKTETVGYPQLTSVPVRVANPAPTPATHPPRPKPKPVAACECTPTADKREAEATPAVAPAAPPAPPAPAVTPTAASKKTN